MKITIDSQVIQTALRTVARLAAPASGNVTIEAKDGKLHMMSLNDSARASYLMACTVKGEGMFALPVEALIAATKGHAELECEYTNSMFKIKGGRTEVKMATVDAIPADEAEDGKGTSWKVSPEQVQWLKSSVAAVALKPTSQITTYMPVTVKLGPKSSFVACYDEHHMAFLIDKEVTGEMEFTLPLETLTAVFDSVVGAFTMKLGNAMLKISNKQMQVYLSLPDEDAGGEINVSDVLAQAKEAQKADGKDIAIMKDDALAFLENARAVQTKERSEVRVKGEGSNVKLSVTTTNGDVKTQVKALEKVKGVEFGVAAQYFEEAIRKAGPEVRFRLVDDAFLAFKTKAITVVVSLNQDDGQQEEQAED